MAGILAGSTNVPLSSYGIKEAKFASYILNPFHFNYVFTSDLQRTTQTYEIIRRNMYYNPILCSSKELNERDYGSLTGIKKDDLKNIYSEKDFYKWRHTYYGRPPNGENLDDVRKRIGHYYNCKIEPLLKQKQNVLVISHSNSLRALFVHIGLKNEETIEHFEINNCVPISIDINNKKFWYIKE